MPFFNSLISKKGGRKAKQTNKQLWLLLTRRHFSCWIIFHYWIEKTPTNRNLIALYQGYPVWREMEGPRCKEYPLCYFLSLWELDLSLQGDFLEGLKGYNYLPSPTTFSVHLVNWSLPASDVSWFAALLSPTVMCRLGSHPPGHINMSFCIVRHDEHMN